jgi:hypothetical protein
MRIKTASHRFLVGLIILFQIVRPVYAQHSSRFFHGIVLDNETKLPVGNVNFKVEGKSTGTVSDRNGVFSFRLDTIPALLTVSCIGYQAKKIVLDSGTERMTLYLIPAVTQLREVIINAKPYDVFFKDGHYSILDYRIDSGLVYLLVYRDRFSRAELICRKINGDTVARSGLLDFNPRSLEQDCLGFFHILTLDSAYQVYREGKSMMLFRPVPLKKYQEVLYDCITSTPRFLYFRRSTDLGLGTEFYLIDRENYKWKWIARVKDEKRITMLRKNPGDAWMLMSVSQPDQDGSKVSELFGTVSQANEDFEKWNWVKKVVYCPLKSFLYRIGDFLCIFNIPEKRMEFYDLQGNFSYIIQLEMDHVSEGRWTNDILIDESTRKVFTTYSRNGLANLFEIDLNTGSLTKKLTSFYPFPQKMTLYNDYLYYLYDDPVAPDNKMLFRQGLY